MFIDGCALLEQCAWGFGSKGFRPRAKSGKIRGSTSLINDGPSTIGLAKRVCHVYLVALTCQTKLGWETWLCRLSSGL